MQNKNPIYLTALQYIECEVSGKKINIPYMIHDQSRYCSLLSKGKAPLSEILPEFLYSANQKKIDLSKLSAPQLKEQMRSLGIGIDCSGFAFHLLNILVTQKTGRDLSHFLVRFPGLLGKIDQLIFAQKRYRKISAAMLTSQLNTVEVARVSEILPGDLIRMTHPTYTGKHPLVVVEVTPGKILYAHSSEFVATNGAHFGEIMIVDVKAGLKKQKWLELSRDGKNYGEVAFHPELGDSVRRLTCLL